MKFDLETVLFFSLSVLAVGSATMMITRRSPISSALFLILNFFTVSGLYLLLKAQFIAIIQVLVYMGAIMVLFLFVIMLLNLHDEGKLKEKYTYRKLTAVLLSIFLFCLLGLSGAKQQLSRGRLRSRICGCRTILGCNTYDGSVLDNCLGI